MDSLERINDRLAPCDLVIMQQDNLRYALYRIERGAVQVPGHAERYDRYVRIGCRSFASLTAAMLAAERAVSR
jgi:hypothetical protein